MAFLGYTILAERWLAGPLSGVLKEWGAAILPESPSGWGFFILKAAMGSTRH